ncbi:hypothetical protein DRQ50_00045 [bacterium]|nr:MAG: hypothetical protein DRQ50_00045 [bacterium]
MSLFIVKIAGVNTLRDGVNQVVVAADDAAAAKLAAASLFTGDASWAGATTTEVVDTVTVATAAALIGWRFRVSVSGIGHADVLGVITTLDTLDKIGTEMAVQLNLLTGIANAAYVGATQVLTVATGGGGDDVGDNEVTVLIQSPILSNAGGQYSGDANLEAAFVSAVVDGGAAADPLTVTFNADTTIVPLVLGQGSAR